MAIIIDELKAVLGIQVDKQKFQDAENSVKKINQSFFGVKTAITLAATALVAFEAKMAGSLAALGRSERMLSVNSTDFQVLEHASKKAGISFDSVTGAISKLNTELAGLTSGKPPVELLKNLGKLSTLSGVKISPFDNGKLKNGYELIQEILPAFEKLTKEQKLIFSQDIFGSNILPALEKIKEAKSELSKNGLILGSDEVHGLDKVNQQFILLGKTIEVTFKRIAIALSPIFEEVNKQLIKFIPEIQKIAQAFTSWVISGDALKSFEKLSSVLGVIGDAAGLIGSAFNTVGKTIGNVAGFFVTEHEKFRDEALTREAGKSSQIIAPQNTTNNNTTNNSTVNNNNSNGADFYNGITAFYLGGAR